MSKRLEILQNSLLKKEAELQKRFNEHFATVKQANGQPLNDKRNGHATMKKWEKQSDAIRNLEKSIEATKRAIELEESKIANVERTQLPVPIIEFIQDGKLSQWRRHPNTFFVNGIDKARICWDGKQLAHKYYNAIPDAESRKKFAEVYNTLRALVVV